MKHTKGEWKVEKGGELVLPEHLTHLFQIRAGDTAEVIADIITDGKWVDTNDEANAKLIAAAPELLKALQRMVNMFNRGLPENSIGKEVCNEALSAIKKATE